MPSETIRIHPAAEQEAEAAFDWYLERSSAAARAFLRELDRAIKCVSESPKQWGMHIGGTRRYVFSTAFPFN